MPNHGKLENSWIINYETGEVKNVGDIRRLKDIENLDEVEEIGDNIILSSSDSLAVEEGLILNIDSSVIDGDVANEQEALQERLGEGVELVNFDYNDESGLTPTSFNFDGVNDYIKVPYDDSLMYHVDGTKYMGTDEETGEEKQLTKKEVFARNGFTFEFYGIFEKGKSYNNGKEISATFDGILGYWNGLENKQADMRFGFMNSGASIFWNAGYNTTAVSDYSSSPDVWNQMIDVGFSLYDGKPHYLSVSVDVSEKYKKDGNGEHFKHTVYLDGKNIADGGFNVLTWEYFCNGRLKDLNCFCIGRSSMNWDGAWNYTKMFIYAMRIYNKSLSEEELMDNYVTSVIFHQFLVKLYT